MTNSTPPEVGDPAPAFSLPAAGGETVSLADFAGGALVLYFYPRDDTPGCTTEALEFTADTEAFAAAGARIVGVSKDIHVTDAFAALDFELAEEDIAEIEAPYRPRGISGFV